MDVVVTEGFTGNIALKAAEGTAKQLSTYLRLCLQRTLLSKVGAFLAQGAFRALKDRMDPRKHNGGVFLGLNGVVVKSHGSASPKGVANAVGVAAKLVDAGVDTVFLHMHGLTHDFTTTRKVLPSAAAATAKIIAAMKLMLTRV